LTGGLVWVYPLINEDGRQRRDLNPQSRKDTD
jgi:hypothetical protein